jgi:hypothetical protein
MGKSGTGTGETEMRLIAPRQAIAVTTARKTAIALLSEEAVIRTILLKITKSW